MNFWKKQIYSVGVSDSELNWIDFNERKLRFLSDTIKLFDNRSRTKHLCLVLMKSILSEWESDYWTHLILLWLALAQYRFQLSSTELSCASHLILQAFCSFDSIHFNHSLKTAFISAIKIQSFNSRQFTHDSKTTAITSSWKFSSLLAHHFLIDSVQNI